MKENVCISSYAEKIMELEEIGKTIVKEIDAEIQKFEIKGVQKVSASPNIVIVPFSRLSREIWQPEHYISDAQIKAIRKYLEPCGNNPLKLIERLKKICEEKKIRRSSCTGDVVFIHDDIIGGIKKVIEKYSIKEEKENVKGEIAPIIER